MPPWAARWILLTRLHHRYSGPGTIMWIPSTRISKSVIARAHVARHGTRAERADMIDLESTQPDAQSRLEMTPSWMGYVRIKWYIMLHFYRLLLRCDVTAINNANLSPFLSSFCLMQNTHGNNHCVICWDMTCTYVHLLLLHRQDIPLRMHPHIFDGIIPPCLKFFSKRLFLLILIALIASSTHWYMKLSKY